MRTCVKINIHDNDGALSDANKAIELEPGNPESYFDRGILNYDKRLFDQALVDFTKSTVLSKEDPDNLDYSWMRIWLIRSRIGDEKAATKDVLDFIATRNITSRSTWSLELLKYLAGSIDDRALLAASKTIDQKTEKEHLCEAFFYIGSRLLISGNSAGERTVNGGEE